MTASFPPQRLVTGGQLGDLLRGARKQRKLTQADVAVRLSLSQHRVSYLERHAEELSVQQLLVWCAALGLDVSIGMREPMSGQSSPAEW